MKKERNDAWPHHYKLWRKMLMFMKLLSLLLFGVCMSLHANVLSQDVKVSVNLNEVALTSVLEELSRQSKCDFFYNYALIATKGKVSVQAKSRELRLVLDELLPGVGLTYSFDGHVVVIKEKIEDEKLQPKSIRIKGMVVDEGNFPLPGVTVKLKNSDLGTATDKDGKFSFVIPKIQDVTLIFSFIGMETKEVKYSGQDSIRVVLKELKLQMDEVVVTGYQVIDKRKLSSSITSVKAEDLTYKGAISIDQMLEGVVPGLMISTLSSTPGAASKMRLRGSSTFTGTREPLWVIDGIIYEDPVPLSADQINSWDNINLIGNAITGLNPQDIERIDVLKDASATAIYGTRAANGVIVVTTKQGKVGLPQVSYSGNLKVTRRPKYSDFDLMNSKERIEVSREIVNKGLYYPTTPSRLGYEGAVWDFWDKKISYEEYEQRVYDMETLNYDWFGELFDTATSQGHSLSISGGGDVSRYYFSFGYNEEKGTERGTNVQRYTTRMNLNSRLRENLNVAIGLSGSVANSKYNYSGYSVFDEAYYTSRAIPLKDANGHLVYVNRRVAESNATVQYNILQELNQSERKIINKSLNLTASLNWDIFNGLRYSGTVGLSTTSNMQEEWIGEDTFWIKSLRAYSSPTIYKGGVYGSGMTNQYAWTVRNQLNWSKRLGREHFVNIDLGQEARSTIYWGNSGSKYPGYQHDQGQTFVPFPSVGMNETMDDYLYSSALTEWFIGSGSPAVYPSITNRKSNQLSYFATMTYSYGTRFSLNFNIRNDGSNQFGQYERARFNPVWSVSGRWNLEQESFLQADYLDQLALRVSYGFRGNVPNASPYLLIDRPVENSFLGDHVAGINSFPNGNLEWEKTTTFNVGVDFSLLKGRISGTTEYYYSRSVDLLTSRPISLANGESSRFVNDGTATNMGVEFSFRSVNMQTDNFRWSTSLTASYNYNQVKRGDQDNRANNYQNYLSGSVIKNNSPVDGFYSYQFERLDEHGLPRFENLTLDPTGMSRDEYLEKIFVYEGSRAPLVFGSFATEFSYKNWSLRAGFNYKIGHKVRLLNMYGDASSALPTPEKNMRKIFTERWKSTGDEQYTNVPGLSNASLDMYFGSGTPVDGYQYSELPAHGYRMYVGPLSNTGWYMYDHSDLRTADASHIRIRDISIGYTFPEKFLKIVRLSAARLDFQVQNVGVICFDKKLRGQDPDQVQSVGVPVLPAYNFNLSVSF